LALPIWIFAITGDEVDWRGKKYKVLRNGEAERVEDASSRRWFRWNRRDNYEPLNQT
jgi:ceramide glucosyltransferase